MVKILVVEDDSKLRRVYGALLKKNGYDVFDAGDGNTALAILDTQKIDLMLCDVMMPGMDGFELTRQLRAAGYEFPILMATARDTFPSKQEGFKAGTDDYMVKPIDLNELLLRIEALLRRARIASDRQFGFGTTRLVYDSFTLTQNGTETVLPQKEFQLMYKLLGTPGKVFTRQQLMDDIWGLDSGSDLRTVDVHINKLRERLRSNPDYEIATVRGLGYRAVKKHE